MDDPIADRVARLLAASTSRRLAAGLGAVLASLSPRSTGANGGRGRHRRGCMPIGFRCGGRGQRPCRRCCSGFATDSGTAQQRCTCRRFFDPCQRDDQCCDGLCLLDPPSTGVDVAVCVQFPPVPPPAG